MAKQDDRQDDSITRGRDIRELADDARTLFSQMDLALRRHYGDEFQQLTVEKQLQATIELCRIALELSGKNPQQQPPKATE